MYRWLILLLGGLFSCQSTPRLVWSSPKNDRTGSEFYRSAASMGWKQRDSLLLDFVEKGNVPAFLSQLVPVQIAVSDSISGQPIRATFFVSPDYLSIGINKDWARVPVSAKTAAVVLAKLRCFAPTPQLVSRIHEQARVKLEPVPLFAYRDSTPTMWHHHLIIEGQRKGKKGLISGIKKDIVFLRSPKDSVRADRVGIYGWYRLNNQPIQPFYQGHVWWYADYSHGLRLVYRKIRVEKRWVEIEEVLKDPRLRQLLF
jgi:hypothetical protein